MRFHKFIDWFKVGHRFGMSMTVLFFVVLAAIDPSLHTIHNLYSAMWSNIWAPSIWTLLGFAIADFRHAKRMNLMKAHDVHVASSLHGRIDALADKLREVIGGDDDPEDKPRQDRPDADPR